MIRAIAIWAVSFALLSAQVPPKAAEAITRFQQAVASEDLDSLAAVAHFPIKSNEFPTIKNPAELKKFFPKIFPPNRKAGLVGQAPVAQLKGFVSVFSKQEDDPIQFLFQRYGKEYLWCSIDNVNE
jgi:hypothetical protein